MDNNTSNQEPLLRVEHLCQYFKAGSFVTKAVDDVSFDIKKGEVFGLVGESGCGKTTTGRSIIKLYNITSGNVYFKGVRIAAGTQSYKDELRKAKGDREKIAKLKAEIRAANNDQKNCDRMYSKKLVEQCKEKFEPLLASASSEEKPKIESQYKDELRKAKNTKLVTRIQMIFQDPIASLDPRMTVREIIAEGLITQGERNKDVIDQKVYEMLELVGLVKEHATRYPHEFSGGQRQRIGVARSIIMNPDLIIADEPVSALDVSVQAQVINLLNELRDRFGLTILFIAHDLSVVKYFSDRIGVMYFGKMVELADSNELFAHPLHPYTRSLLSAIPLPDPVYEKTRKRIVYNPIAEHDYQTDKPTFREVRPGHFVQCNEAEYQQIMKELNVHA